MKYALDTNIITYYLKGNEKIIDKVDKEAENDNIIIPLGCGAYCCFA
jgi:hypothetical protein